MPASFALKLLSVGSPDRSQQRSAFNVAEDFNVGHHAMAADDTGKVRDGREERYFSTQRDHLVVVRPRPIAKPFDFLRPGDHDSKIGRLAQFPELSRLRRR